MYNFANSNLKKKSHHAKRRSERCSGRLVRGSNVRLQTRLCDLLGGDCTCHVCRCHIRNPLRIHTSIMSMTANLFAIFVFSLRITRAYVRPVRNESRAIVTATVKRSTITGARASRFGLSTRPIVPSISIVHE